MDSVITERKADKTGRQVSVIAPSFSWCLYDSIGGWSGWACRSSWPACFYACPTVWQPERCLQFWTHPSDDPANEWLSRERPAVTAILSKTATGECVTRWETVSVPFDPSYMMPKTLPVPRLPLLRFLPLFIQKKKQRGRKNKEKVELKSQWRTKNISHTFRGHIFRAGMCVIRIRRKSATLRWGWCWTGDSQQVLSSWQHTVGRRLLRLLKILRGVDPARQQVTHICARLVYLNGRYHLRSGNSGSFRCCSRCCRTLIPRWTPNV